MSNPLRVLILEDRANDAELILRELRRAGLDPQWQRVETEADYLAALAPPPDLILADYTLPHFDGLRALRQLRERGLDIPFILVSGTIGEDRAVEAMKLGATDYLLKDRIARLGGAVERALTERRLRAERRLVEEELRASERRYRRLFEAAKDGILIVNAETGMIEDVNPFLTGLLGLTKADCLRKKVWELGCFQNLVANHEKFVELQRNEYVRYENLPLQAVDGRRIAVEVVSNVYAVNGGKVIQCNIRDITERHQAKERLQESERLYHSLVESLPQNIFRKDRDGRFTFVNARFGQTLGRPLTEILGRTDADFFPPELAAKYRADDRRVMETGQPWEAEEEHRNARGNTFTVQVSKTPLRDAAGLVVGVQGVFADITERKQAEAARAQRTAELERFHRLSVGRELQMIELKQEINELAKLTGRTPPYAASSLGTKPTPPQPQP